MDDLFDARARLGLRQDQAAYLLGTTRQAYSLAETRGVAGPVLRARLEAFAALPATSAYATRPLMTCASSAATARTERKAGDEDFALRMLLQGVDDLHALEQESDIALHLARPGGTGDSRWDTLLAGLVARATRIAGIEAPSWCRVAPLPTHWWVSGETLTRHRTRLRGSADLAALNVMAVL